MHCVSALFSNDYAKLQAVKRKSFSLKTKKCQIGKEYVRQMYEFKEA